MWSSSLLGAIPLLSVFPLESCIFRTTLISTEKFYIHLPPMDCLLPLFCGPSAIIPWFGHRFLQLKFPTVSEQKQKRNSV